MHTPNSSVVQICKPSTTSCSIEKQSSAGHASMTRVSVRMSHMHMTLCRGAGGYAALSVSFANSMTSVGTWRASAISTFERSRSATRTDDGVDGLGGWG